MVLYYVKSRMKEDKIPAMADLIDKDGFPVKARHVFASLDDHHVGMTFWEVKDEESFESIKEKLSEYLDILEVMPVVSAEDVYAQSLEKNIPEGN